MRTLTRGALAALPLALTLAVGLTGCGSGDGGGGGGDGVASADGGEKDKAAASSEPSLSRDEMAVKFAECMRENGIDMEDPKPGKGVMLKVDKRTAKGKLDEALEACREYNPQGEAGEKGGDPEKPQEFAECMRKNGVEDFPDPEPGQRGIRMDGKTQEDPDAKAAAEKCQKSVFSGGPKGKGGGR